ncbi:UNVERIFIED_CONTAM: 7-deoxyloganetin glucosyltransferase [Sesamum calycinum]|uniref:7-deoxyloganetin glucosyltransferase n=1 Tax=Sesamum calycinum TaxID=2727403 RepID=A0AAW2PAL0_9LAMI
MESPGASAIVLNTFEDLERDVLDALSSILPTIYAIGPLHLLENQVDDKALEQLGSNLWKDEPECLEWLDTKDPNSVVYVNFGSITVMTSDQLVEFAWGLANSNLPFLWVIRPDLVSGDKAVLRLNFSKPQREEGCWRIGALKREFSATLLSEGS